MTLMPRVSAGWSGAHIIEPNVQIYADSEIDLGRISLRRDGLPPLRFFGHLIAQHDGRLPLVPIWHEIGLYRASNGGYVTRIVAYMAAESKSPLTKNDTQGLHAARCHAASFETLEGALQLLEQHDASRDVCPGLSAPGIDFNDATLSPIALVMQATMLHSFCRDIMRRYRIGVGALLAGIGLREI